MMKIVQLETAPDISWIERETFVAVRESDNDVMYRTTAGDISDRLNSKDYFSKLTEDHYHDLCDIVWFLKGQRSTGNCAFTDQIDALEQVARCLGDKLRGK